MNEMILEEITEILGKYLLQMQQLENKTVNNKNENSDREGKGGCRWNLNIGLCGKDQSHDTNIKKEE